MAPLPIGNPDLGVQDAELPTGVDEKIFESRLKGMNTFDAAFRKKFKTDEVAAYSQFYDETLQLMDSSDLDAFKLKMEPDYDAKVKKYGSGRLGKGAMLAKRLVSSGIRFIEVKESQRILQPANSLICPVFIH